MKFENYSLWDRLGESDKPIIIYGTGNGADKIMDVLEKYGVKADAVFASNGFVRDRVFRGYHVKSYVDIVEEYGNDITILLAFGTTIPEVRDLINELALKHELLIPDVPLYGGELFDYGYFTEHRERLENAISLLSDDRSKKLFYDAVNFRLTGKPEYLSDTEPIEETLADLFDGVNVKSVLDGGAFKGDSTEIFARVLSPDKIYAVEADPKTYVKLCNYAENEKSCKVLTYNAALSDVDGRTQYISSSSRGSGESGKNKRAKIVETDERRIDSIIGNDDMDFIKLDVEGDEMKSLIGAKECIGRCEPSLAVSLYHKTDDLFELIEYVNTILPEHRLYLRRVPCIPMWDLTLYAIRKA